MGDKEYSGRDISSKEPLSLKEQLGVIEKKLFLVLKELLLDLPEKDIVYLDTLRKELQRRYLFLLSAEKKQAQCQGRKSGNCRRMGWMRQQREDTVSSKNALADICRKMLRTHTGAPSRQRMAEKDSIYSPRQNTTGQRSGDSAEKT